MKKTGTLNLITDGGERKMHYILKEDKIYTTTSATSNKIAQIRKNSEVRIDLDDSIYNATLIEGEEAKKGIENYRKELGFISKLFNKYLGAKDPIIIVLEKK